MRDIEIIRLSVLFILLIIATYTDLSSRKIFNWCTFSAMGVGIGLAVGESLYYENPAYLIPPSIGIALALAVFFLPYYLGWMGGGDLKLITAIGALQGLPFKFTFILHVIFYTSLVGACLSLILLVWRGELLSGILKSFKLIVKPKSTTEEQAKLTIPYGLAISIGTFYAIVINMGWLKI